MAGDATTGVSSVPMALAHVARTIEEFLIAATLDEGARAAAVAAQEDGDDGGAASFVWEQEPAAAALAPLLLAQLRDVVQALQGSHQQQDGEATNPWSFRYQESRGARTEGVAALLRLLRRRLSAAASASTEASSTGVLKAILKALVALLERDRSYQYLAVRVFEEEGMGGLQALLLHGYAARWHREQEDEGGLSQHQQQQQDASFLSVSSCSASGLPTDAHERRVQALFLRLWALLGTSQPLDLPAHDLPLLCRILLGPILRATASAPPLSPPRRRQREREQQDEEWQEEEERDDRHPLLVPSLELLAQAARSSPAFRLCLRAANHRERNMIYDALLSLVVSTQQEAPATPPRLALATMGALAAVVAGDAAFEARVFEHRNVTQMARLAFAHLLDHSDSSSSADHHQARRLAAELLGDMARSPLVLGLLEQGNEEEDEDLPPFLQAAAAALCRGSSSTPHSECWHEPLLRGLRLLCLESPLARARFVRALVGASASPLAALVGLALSAHAPTASEAVGLLQACLPSVDDEENGPALGLWQALAALMLERRPPHTPGRGATGSPLARLKTPPSSAAATAQLNRSPSRRGTTHAAATPRRGTAGAGSSSMLDRLVGEIEAVADEVEVAVAGVDGVLGLGLPPEGKLFGIDAGAGLALLEVEWRLRALLGLAALLLLTHAPMEAPNSLARAVAERLNPRAVAAITLGVARAHAQALRRRQQHQQQHSASAVEEASSSVLGATAAGGTAGHVEGLAAGGLLEAAPFVLHPTAIEPLDVVVLGCRLLVRGAGDREFARWRSAALGGSKEVAEALFVAWSQGASRGLVEEAAALLIDLARHDPPSSSPEWCALLDAFHQHNQRRDACIAAMAQRLAAAEEALQEAALELEVKDGLLAQEDEREAALLEQHDRTLAAVEAALTERVGQLEEALEAAHAEHAHNLGEIQAERDTLQAAVEDMNGRLEAEAAGRAAAEQVAAAEVAALRARLEDEARGRAAAEAGRDEARAALAVVQKEAAALAEACEAKNRAVEIAELKIRRVRDDMQHVDGRVRLEKARAGEKDAEIKRLEDLLRQSEAARVEDQARREAELLAVLEEVSGLRRLVEAKGEEIAAVRRERDGALRLVGEREASLFKMRAAVRALRASMAAGGSGKG